MGFKYAETDNCYHLLITDPRRFLERLKTTGSMDHLIRDVDLDTYEYDGLNIFHCLSRIVGNSEPNNFGDTVDFPSSLGCELFDLLRARGANPYHYGDNCCSPLDMAKMCGNKGNREYLVYINNFYTNNPPELDDITVSKDCFNIISGIIAKNVQDNNDLNISYLELTESEYVKMMGHLTKQYILYGGHMDYIHHINNYLSK